MNIFKYLRMVSYPKDKRDKVGINLGIPVVVFDIKNNESFEYLSINEAARSLKAHPKTIWRKVYNDKLYLGRFKLTIKNNYKNKIGNYLNNKLNYTNKIIKHNSKLFYYLMLLAIIGLVVYIIISYVVFIYKDIYNDYISNISIIKVDHYRNTLKYKYILYDSVKEPLVDNKYFYKKKLISFDWGWNTINLPWIYKESLLVNNKFGIYQTIISSINLDFHNDAISIIDNSSPINKMHSSPIMGRIDLNKSFYTLTRSVINKIASENPLGLGIEGMQNISITRSNRSSLILDTSIALNQDKIKATELLNYQSNILYLMINGISPSIY